MFNKELKQAYRIAQATKSVCTCKCYYLGRSIHTLLFQQTPSLHFLTADLLCIPVKKMIHSYPERFQFLLTFTAYEVIPELLSNCISPFSVYNVCAYLQYVTGQGLHRQITHIKNLEVLVMVGETHQAPHQGQGLGARGLKAHIINS